MLRIGIIGGNNVNDTAKIINKINGTVGIESQVERLNLRTLQEYKNEFSNEITDFKSYDNLGYNFIVMNSLDSNTDFLLNTSDKLNSTFILIDNDDSKINQILKAKLVLNNIVTFGLNLTSFVTASSITDDCIQCCIQKPLVTCSGKIIEEQEFSIKTSTYCKDIYPVLSSTAIVLLSDVDINIFQKSVIL